MYSCADDKHSVIIVVVILCGLFYDDVSISEYVTSNIVCE
jgi:hypothetical protein